MATNGGPTSLVLRHPWGGGEPPCFNIWLDFFWGGSFWLYSCLFWWFKMVLSFKCCWCSPLLWRIDPMWRVFSDGWLNHHLADGFWISKNPEDPWYPWKLINLCYELTIKINHLSGQIIATSHDLGPQMVVKSKGNPLFQGNLGWLY